MFDIWFIPLFLIAGILAGIGAGMFGIGGGIIFVPVITFALSFISGNENNIFHIAIATSILAIVFTSGNSFLNHHNRDNIDYNTAFLIFSGSFISSLILPFIVVNIDKDTLRYILAGLLIFVSLKYILEVTGLFTKTVSLPKFFLFAAGLIIGGFSAFSGLGGGILYTPAMNNLFSVDIKKSVGTSSFIVFISSVIAAVSFGMQSFIYTLSDGFIGYINLPTAVLMGIGGIIGAKYGVKIISASSTIAIKIVFSVFLILISILIMINI